MQQSSNYTASKTGMRNLHSKSTNNNTIGSNKDKDDNNKNNNFRNSS